MSGSAKLAVSLEFYPNKVLGTCPFNNGWIQACYGKEAAKSIARHVVSCSGVTLGSRNSILVYVSSALCAQNNHRDLMSVFIRIFM